MPKFLSKLGGAALVLLAPAALADEAAQSVVYLASSFTTPAARAREAQVCPTGVGFPAQWTWSPTLTTPKPRAAAPSDNLTPKIEQYRAGKLVATWRSFSSNPATCSFGDPSASNPVDLKAAAASGCGPFGNYAHVDLWNPLKDGDVFLVYPAVYAGAANNMTFSAKPDFWTDATHAPSNIVVRGVTQNGVRPLLLRDNSGQGDFATAQAAIYLFAGSNIVIDNIDLALAPTGAVGKAGVYINGVANLSLRDMRIRDFAWQANGQDGQNGVFATENNTGFLNLLQIEAVNNGGPNGPTHNFYINKSATDPTFTVRLYNSWSHDAVYGHTFKSRAQRNMIIGNYFQGGLPQTARGQTQAENYLLDLPNGGVATVIDNIFVKNASGPNSNGMSFTFAMEGVIDARAQQVTLRNNTFVALARTYDGAHDIYPLSFFYPNVVPGTPAWPANVAVSVRDNLFVGYCPTSTTYLPSGNYRGERALTAAFSEFSADFSLKQKYYPANDNSILRWGLYNHVTRAGDRRLAPTIGARD